MYRLFFISKAPSSNTIRGSLVIIVGVCGGIKHLGNEETKVFKLE
jgi:hypothetical protein